MYTFSFLADFLPFFSHIFDHSLLFEYGGLDTVVVHTGVKNKYSYRDKFSAH